MAIDDHMIVLSFALQKMIQRVNPEASSEVTLKPNVAACVAAKLGATHVPGADHDLFVFGDHDDPHEADPTDQVIIGLIPEEDLPEHIVAGEEPGPDDGGSTVIGGDANRVNRAYEVLQECAVAQGQLAPGLRKAVATREGKKAFRAALGMQGPQGKLLPEDVARTIGKMAATPKLGGRKTRKAKTTRKTKKAKKSTRRR